MTKARRAERDRWLVAGLASVGLMIGGAVMLRGPNIFAPTGVPRSRTSVSVTTVGDANAALTEEALLFDPTPLFLPTEWNAAQNAWNDKNTKMRMEPGHEFARLAPKWNFEGPTLAIGMAEPILLPENAAAAVVEDVPPPFAGFGREPFAVEALPSRGARLEVRNTSSGRIIFSETLSDAQPPGDGLWQPIELDAAVDAAGLIGSLVISRRSDVEGVDDYFRSYLAQSRHLGQILSPGFYHLILGP